MHRSNSHQRNYQRTTTTTTTTNRDDRGDDDDFDRHYHYHHHHHHQNQQHRHHHHHHHHHSRQHRSHQSLLHYRRDARSQSPSSPSGSLRGRSPRRTTSRIRSSSLTSRRSTPSPTPTASPAQTTSPSPPTLLKGEELNRFQHLPIDNNNSKKDRCFWGLLPRGKMFRCHADGSARIDVCARIFFPLVFFIFNLGYWSCYLFPHEDHTNMHK